MTETPLRCWPELRHGPAPEQACTLYTPSAPGPWPLVLCIHGGGWILGRRFGYNRLAMPLAQQGFACATVDYRKLDQHPWPTPIDDCLACLDLLRSRATELDIDGENLALVGDSAGGHLALLMAPSLCPKAVVGISAPCDLGPPWKNRHPTHRWPNGPLRCHRSFKREKASRPPSSSMGSRMNWCMCARPTACATGSAN
jgi:acetyl esterase/lipase